MPRSALVSVAALGGVALLAGVARVVLERAERNESVVTWLEAHHLREPRSATLRATLRYERGDPEGDARRAIAAGDARLMATMTAGRSFPGLSADETERIAPRYGTKEYVYVGCVVQSDEERHFREAAWAFAARYNRTIVAHSHR